MTHGGAGDFRRIFPPGHERLHRRQQGDVSGPSKSAALSGSWTTPTHSWAPATSRSRRCGPSGPRYEPRRATATSRLPVCRAVPQSVAILDRPEGRPRLAVESVCVEPAPVLRSSAVPKDDRHTSWPAPTVLVTGDLMTVKELRPSGRPPPLPRPEFNHASVEPRSPRRATATRRHVDQVLAARLVAILSRPEGDRHVSSKAHS